MSQYSSSTSSKLQPPLSKSQSFVLSSCDRFTRFVDLCRNHRQFYSCAFTQCPDYIFIRSECAPLRFKGFSPTPLQLRPTPVGIYRHVYTRGIVVERSPVQGFAADCRFVLFNIIHLKIVSYLYGTINITKQTKIIRFAILFNSDSIAVRVM